MFLQVINGFSGSEKSGVMAKNMDYQVPLPTSRDRLSSGRSQKSASLTRSPGHTYRVDAAQPFPFPPRVRKVVCVAAGQNNNPKCTVLFLLQPISQCIEFMPTEITAFDLGQLLGHVIVT